MKLKNEIDIRITKTDEICTWTFECLRVKDKFCIDLSEVFNAVRTNHRKSFEFNRYGELNFFNEEDILNQVDELLKTVEFYNLDSTVIKNKLIQLDVFYICTEDFKNYSMRKLPDIKKLLEISFGFYQLRKMNIVIESSRILTLKQEHLIELYYLILKSISRAIYQLNNWYSQYQEPINDTELGIIGLEKFQLISNLLLLLKHLR